MPKKDYEASKIDLQYTLLFVYIAKPRMGLGAE